MSSTEAASFEGDLDSEEAVVVLMVLLEPSPCFLPRESEDGGLLQHSLGSCSQSGEDILLRPVA